MGKPNCVLFWTFFLDKINLLSEITSSPSILRNPLAKKNPRLSRASLIHFLHIVKIVEENLTFLVERRPSTFARVVSPATLKHWHHAPTSKVSGQERKNERQLRRRWNRKVQRLCTTSLISHHKQKQELLSDDFNKIMTELMRQILAIGLLMVRALCMFCQWYLRNVQFLKLFPLIIFRRKILPK